MALIRSERVLRVWRMKPHRTSTRFRSGRATGALTVLAKCGNQTRIAPVWVVSGHHGSSVLLGYQPRSGLDAGGPIIASLATSGADARNRNALRSALRSSFWSDAAPEQAQLAAAAACGRRSSRSLSRNWECRALGILLQPVQREHEGCVLGRLREQVV